MRKVTRRFVGILSSITAAAVIATGAMTAASADPINSSGAAVTPQSYDVVGVGSDTTQYVIDQMSLDYNKTIPASTHNANHPYFYSWDAVPPGATAPGNYTISPKAGCPTITRPNGSSAGLAALDANTWDGTTGHRCVDFGRSSGPRTATAPPLGAGGVSYVALARDVVTWATRTVANGGSDAPTSLTQAQLQGIFQCKTTNWSQVGGKNAAIKVYLPQPGSGSLSFWEKAMNITTLGSCVSQAPEENEGTNSVFNSPQAIFIFSVGSFIAQKFHSAACGAKPTSTQNRFGCNATGYLGINQINKIAPRTYTSNPVINPSFPSAFYRTLYDILRYNTTSSDHIPPYLEKWFSKTGYFCTNATAKADIKAYGFVTTNLCGSIS